MPSIIKEVVDAGRVHFSLPPQAVEKNSDKWRRKYFKRSGERKAKTPTITHVGSPIYRLSQISASRPARDMPPRKPFRD